MLVFSFSSVLLTFIEACSTFVFVFNLNFLYHVLFKILYLSVYVFPVFALFYLILLQKLGNVFCDLLLVSFSRLNDIQKYKTQFEL